jgi:hypothetical protein
MNKTLLGLIASCWLLVLPAYAAPPQLDAGATVLAQVAGKPARVFSTTDFGRTPNPQARSVLVPGQEAPALLALVRAQLPPELVAFVGVTNSLAMPKPAGVELVVAPGRDQFDILHAAKTDGINYDMDTEAIVAELRAWDREFGIDIWQAETDTVQLRLKSMPRNLPAFAQRVYKFCPDIVDQGVGNVKALAREIEKTKSITLWWD